MVYTLGDKMWYQYGASRSEGRNLMPAPLLQWEVMRWGARHADMLSERPDGGLQLDMREFHRVVATAATPTFPYPR